jgi:hypothetical protein
MRPSGRFAAFSMLMLLISPATVGPGIDEEQASNRRHEGAGGMRAGRAVSGHRMRTIRGSLGSPALVVAPATMRPGRTNAGYRQACRCRVSRRSA